MLLVIFITIQLMWFTHYLETKQPKVELPEEYYLITKDDVLRGYIDENQVLHLYFDNNIK